MATAANFVQMRVQLSEAAPDANSLEESALKLRDILLDFDVLGVDHVRKAAPEGSKSGDLVAAAGTLLVTLAQSPELIGAVIEGITSWTSRRAGRTAKVTLGGNTLELTGVSSVDQRRLIEHFIKRTG